jgi:hypothetical protein
MQAEREYKGNERGRAGIRGGGPYLEELESLEIIAGDDIDVLAGTWTTVMSPRVWVLPPGPGCSRQISTGGRLTEARRSSALNQLESASTSTSN